MLAILSSLPLLATAYPPLQDAPAHAAAIRVLASYSDPAYGLGAHFVETLGRTQYLLYYFVGALGAKVASAEFVNRVLACVYVVGTPYAIRSVIRAIGRDDRAALLSFLLVTNPLFMLGLFPFLIGVTTMFFGIAASIRFTREPSKRRGLVVAGFGSLLFFLHVVPLALFALTHAALSATQKPPRVTKNLIPLLPIVALLGGWTLLTDAGHSSTAALIHPNGPSPLSLVGKLLDAYNWVGDVWVDLSDEAIFACAALVTLVIGLLGRQRVQPRLPRGYLAFVGACVLGALALGDHHDHIYPIWQRFPVLGLLGAIAYLPWPTGGRARAATLAASVLTLASIASTWFHFSAFDREAREYNEAILRIPARQRVAALVFDKKSKVGHTATYLHFASYYLARKGGFAAFTYAGYPHWPYAIRGSSLPPGWEGRAPHNWEWFPERVDPTHDLAPAFDYVLVRGASPPSLTESFEKRWDGTDWHLWQRTLK